MYPFLILSVLQSVYFFWSTMATGTAGTGPMPSYQATVGKIRSGFKCNGVATWLRRVLSHRVARFFYGKKTDRFLGSPHLFCRKSTGSVVQWWGFLDPRDDWLSPNHFLDSKDQLGAVSLATIWIKNSDKFFQLKFHMAFQAYLKSSGSGVSV